MLKKYPHPDIFTFLAQHSTVLYMTSHASLCLPFSFLAQQRSLTKNYRTEKFGKQKPFCSNLPFCRSSVVDACFQSKKHLGYGTLTQLKWWPIMLALFYFYSPMDRIPVLVYCRVTLYQLVC